MLSKEDIEYAVENTEIVIAPTRRIESFGTTVFRFFVLSELMDSVNQVRVRDGEIQAARPEIVTPEQYSKLMLEGFGEQAEGFADWLRQNAQNMAILKYGFQIRQRNYQESVVHEPIEAVTEKIQNDLREQDEDMAAVIKGIDEGWEISLLQFTWDLIRRSADRNAGDFRNEGLL